MKIYTRTGDDGTTALFGGERVPKDHIRVEAYGAVDEANSYLGLAIAFLNATPGMSTATGEDEFAARVGEQLQAIQSDLFTIGSELATPANALTGTAGRHIPRLTAQRVSDLEILIDTYEQTLTPLRSFILPGGTRSSAALHIARVAVRGAERRVVSLAVQTPLNPQIQPYLNRLSDLLFVVARAANAAVGVADIPWQHPSLD